MRATREYRMALTEEARGIVSQMTLEEKVNLMSANLDVSIMTPEYAGKMMSDDTMHYNVTPYEAGGCERFNLPPMKFADGPRGVVCGNGQSTCFPVSMARGATFDTALEEKVGRAIGREVRAYGGNMIMMAPWYDAANAIVMAYYPGQEGGTALAGILYGDVNPSGKLPFVVPFDEADLPWVDWEAADQYYEYYHGYTRLDKNGVKPLVPYGYGLSYTSFDISAPVLRVEGDRLLAEIAVQNTGERAGDEVVQLYAGYENSEVDRPLRQLCGFARVSLDPGEGKVVRIEVPLEKLKWYDPVHRQWKLEAMEYTFYAGSSEALEDLKGAAIRL